MSHGRHPLETPALSDPFGRRIEYLRLAVTYRCDLLRHVASDDALVDAIRAAVRLKPRSHAFSDASRPVIRVMAATGG